MAVKTYAEDFVPAIETCEEIQNAGSLIKVANLFKCASEPTVYELTPAAAADAGDESIDLYISSPTGTTPAPQVRLQKGTKLYFGVALTPVTVSADTLVTGTAAGSATTVPVDPLETAIAATDKARTWGLQMILSPTDIPVTDNDTTVDRSDLTYGLQGSQVKTGKEKSSQITTISRTDDRAFWEVIYPASQGAQNIFAHIIRTGGVHVWGVAKVMSLTQPGTIREIKRDQFNLMFQAPYAAPTLRQYITDTALQNTFDTVMRLSGI